MKDRLHIRKRIYPSDREAIRSIIESTGVFSSEEIHIAVDLAEDRLKNGAKSGYCFLFAEIEEKVAGYSCYGAITGTKGSFDLYWIAVHKDLHGRGLGKRLLTQTESIIKKEGGRCIYAETSSKPYYRRTRAFYRHCGYKKEAKLKDFYSPGDSKIIYVKTI